ncbi:MAG: hypothetical protein OES84_01640 [Kiritimatiellaceae bacterium]|nr:hypothetical protein [Kiritimatiellaceae bacterium]
MKSFFLKLLVAGVATGIYLCAVRFAPSNQPYYIFAIALVGLVSWLFGSLVGLVYAAAMVPVTNHLYQQVTSSANYMNMALSPTYIGMQAIAAVVLAALRKEEKKHAQKDADLHEANERLQDVLHNVRELGGIHNFCSSCKKIRDDNDGEWMDIDRFLKEHTKIEFSHGICPDCAEHFHDKPEV